MHRLLTGAVTALAIGVAAAAAQAPTPTKQHIAFTSHNLTLAGFLFRPDGPGPFPAIVWNHGSEKNPGGGPQFDTVAGIFVPHGYVVFAPIRRGHQMSEGPTSSTSGTPRAAGVRLRKRSYACSRPSSLTTSLPASST
jgi:dienelactone hydrolase